jgi:hypothetical protein
MVADPMARISEEQLATWTSQASNAEQDRYDWTRRQIRDALQSYAPLSDCSYTVYAKGSYPNFTNVVRDSDVDIAVEMTHPQRYSFVHGAKDMRMENFGVEPYHGPHELAAFKNTVEAALRAHFPASSVSRGDKALKVRESSRGLAADVVPCQTLYEYYRADGSRLKGILLLSDSEPDKRIENYPKQHLDQGVAKNDVTLKRYKRVVRILKNLENRMVKEGVIAEVPSFLIESAVFNVPAGYFTNYDNWTDRVQAALAHIYDGTMTDDCVGNDSWMEANNVKFLFHATQNWRRLDAFQFASKAYDHMGF